MTVIISGLVLSAFFAGGCRITRRHSLFYPESPINANRLNRDGSMVLWGFSVHRLAIFSRHVSAGVL